MDDELQKLPPGDLHFDGETLSVGEWVLTPGRYRLAGGVGVLEVFEPVDDERQDYTD